MKDSQSQNKRRDHFQFTPLQTILINKIMPRGFKLESEENMLRTVESFRPMPKKQKTVRINDKIFRIFQGKIQRGKNLKKWTFPK